MGFYIRKSISVGPFRFNLSKSGVGVSTGIKGFRVGIGPRGNYVQMGRDGLYYRATIPSGSHSSPLPGAYRHEEYSDSLQTPPVMEKIESADAYRIVDSSSEALVNEMNQKRKMIRLWPISAVLLGAAILLSWPKFLALLFVISTAAAYLYDQLRKTTVILFDLDSEAESLYQELHAAFKNISNCSSIWHISAQGDITDWKKNAGASKAVNRKSISVGVSTPPYVKCNVVTPYIPVGKQTLYFFPDKVLVYEKGAVGAVSYKNLMIEYYHQRFIEEEGVPRDAKVVDRTWTFVNKKGGPDRRFKDNRELPIVLYEEVNLKSSTGLNERIQLSKLDVTMVVESAIRNIEGISA